jgi:NADPH-dependent curcumin reductase CurA
MSWASTPPSTIRKRRPTSPCGRLLPPTLFGRIPLCGMISTYNAVTPPPGPNNLMLMVAKRLTMHGFLVGDHADRKAGFREDVGRYVREGRIRVRETVVDGIERAPEAFLALLRGDHIGKMVVRVGPDPA